MRSIAHIINPVKKDENHELSIAQPITFESLKRARSYTKDVVNVDLITSQYSEDRSVIPEYFTITDDLNRSVLDCGDFKVKRKLPLLKDILFIAYHTTNAEYLIYTNVDIGVMPQFYVAVNEIIDQGYDAFAINRRRVSKKYTSVKDLNQIYSEVGRMHNGYDCFVFKRELFPKFELGNVCVGIPHVSNTLFHNLICYSKKFKLFTDRHLTFHIGYELFKEWGDKSYLNHNKSEFLKVLTRLSKEMNIGNFPGAGYPFLVRHFKWLMNPTLHYPTLLKMDIKQRKQHREPIQHEKKESAYREWLQKRIKLDE